MAGLSPAHFAVLFRRASGYGVLEYQTRLRMAAARELLDATDRTIASIANGGDTGRRRPRGCPTRASHVGPPGRTVAPMDAKQEVREFLMTRRAKVTPEQAGLPAGGNRRVPGLRRSEVAMLADVSVEYYSRLERGDLGGVSEAVLDSVARALRLDDAEREHLTRLAALANRSPQLRRARPQQWVPRPGLQRVLDAMPDVPALIRNGRMDLLAANRLARAMYADAYAWAGSRLPVSLPRFTFFDDRARTFYPDWDGAAAITVEILRAEAGRVPYDKELHDLVGELSTRSPEFRTLWGRHDVRQHSSGMKAFHHGAVGELVLAYEGFDLVGEPGLHMTVYTAEPASPTAERLALLASWAATQDEAAEAAAVDGTDSRIDADRGR